jgi:hypothetical protein
MLGLGIDNPGRIIFLSLRTNKCMERINDRPFWNPGVFCYAMIPRWRPNFNVFFFLIVTSIIYGYPAQATCICLCSIPALQRYLLFHSMQNFVFLEYVASVYLGVWSIHTSALNFQKAAAVCCLICRKSTWFPLPATVRVRETTGHNTANISVSEVSYVLKGTC